MDLLGKNAGIMRDVIGRIAPSSPDAIVIVVTNPLDEMTFLAAEESGFPKERVMGMAGVLDSARLRYFIAEELGVSPLVVEAITLGSHGDAMIALPSHATVDGKPLPELVDQATLDRLFQRTRDGGAEIVALLKKGSAYYAPSASIAQMVGAIANDTREILPVCAWATGQYGINDVYVGVPARLGRGGVQEIVELDLSDDETRRAPSGRRGHPREVRGPRERLGVRSTDPRGGRAPRRPSRGHRRRSPSTGRLRLDLDAEPIEQSARRVACASAAGTPASLRSRR